MVELLDDRERRDDLALLLGLVALASFFAVVLVDMFVPLPKWTMGIPAGFYVAAAFVAPAALEVDR